VYVSNGKSKDVGKKGSVSTLTIAVVTALIPLVLIRPVIIPVVLLTLPLVLIPFRWYVIKRIKGYTGDVLGALQQFTELTMYVAWIIAGSLL
jgi:adenosylcobinamide-GDP ribazoletransferase